MPFEYILNNLKRELIRTFAVVDEWFDRDHPLRSFKPSIGGWSINEVLEHIMLTNHFLLLIIENSTEKALKKSELKVQSSFNADDYTLDNKALQEIADPAAFPWQRPEHHQPTGSRTPFEVRLAIRDHLEQCLITLERLPNGEGVLHQTGMSVNNLGKLDVYQYVYFLTLHAQRHLRQMEKVEDEYLNIQRLAYLP